MSQKYCYACYGTSLVVSDGLVICNDCGTQSQAVIEEQEVVENQPRMWRTTAGSSAGNVTAAQRKAATAAAAAEAADAPDPSQQIRAIPPAEQLQLVQEATIAYVRSLTRILKAQAQVLVEELRVQPKVADLMLQLWLAHLPLTGILEPNFWKEGSPCSVTLIKLKPADQKAKMKGWSSSSTAGRSQTDDADDQPDAREGDDDGDDEDMEEEVEYVMTSKTERKVRIPRFITATKLASIWHKALPHHVTLTISFLACYYYREAVMPTDFVAWATSGRLPFIDGPARCEDLYKGMHLEHAVRYALLPMKFAFLDAAGIMHVAQSLARAHGLQLPGVNVHALLYRMVRDMAMPEVLYHAALELCKVHLLLSPLASITASGRQGQAINPYANLAAMLLMAAKMLYGLDGRPRQALPGVPPPPPWLDWAQRVISICPDPSEHVASFDQVRSLPAAALDVYLSFCEQSVFAGGKPVQLLQDFPQMFSKLVSQLQQQEGSERKQKSAVLLATPVVAEQGADAEQAPGPAPAPAGSYYLSGHSLTDRTMHADYTAVLCACGAYIGVKPAALDSILSSFEASAMQVESGVALTMGMPDPFGTKGAGRDDGQGSEEEGSADGNGGGGDDDDDDANAMEDDSDADMVSEDE